MPDEVTTPTTETPTGDALAGTPPPAEAPAEGGEPAPAETPAQPTEGDKARQAEVLAAARELARKESLPEHQAIRKARRDLENAQRAWDAQRNGPDHELAKLRAELAEAEKNPFAFAAKKRGVDEATVYNERTKRAIDPVAAELEDLRKRVEQGEAEKLKTVEDAKQHAAQQRQLAIEQNFRSEVVNVFRAEKGLTYLQAGVEDGEYKPENIGYEVLRRVQAHHAKSYEETGEGEILDPKEVLQTIEKELRAEAKRKAERLAKLESAGQPAIPDREGAVKAAAHEANGSTGPRTLTNALASHTSGTKRKPTRRETLLEAERFLRRPDK